MTNRPAPADVTALRADVDDGHDCMICLGNGIDGSGNDCACRRNLFAAPVCPTCGGEGHVTVPRSLDCGNRCQEWSEREICPTCTPPSECESEDLPL